MHPGYFGFGPEGLGSPVLGAPADLGTPAGFGTPAGLGDPIVLGLFNETAFSPPASFRPAVGSSTWVRATNKLWAVVRSSVNVTVLAIGAVAKTKFFLSPIFPR